MVGEPYDAVVRAREDKEEGTQRPEADAYRASADFLNS